VRADVRNPLVVDNPRYGDPATILSGIPGGYEKYKAKYDAANRRNAEIIAEHKKLNRRGKAPPWETFAAEKGYDNGPHGRAFADVVTGAGHDSILIRQDKLDRAVGGSQLVVFDPRRVVIEGP
jgi:hypothetical protein